MRKSEQDDLQDLIEPAPRGLTRGGATVLTIIPGGFLLHLSSGIVISLAHGYVWDKGNENKEAILAMMKDCLGNLQLPASGASASAAKQLTMTMHLACL
jgi:hypothetical protein